MVLSQLFFCFLKIGAFAFGAAYGAIPLIREAVINYGWFTEESFSYWIAISESIPGPIITELASFVGYQKAGILGAIISTVAVILPSVLIVILIIVAMDKVIENKYFKAFLTGIKPCVVGIILATGVTMLIKNAGVISKFGKNSSSLIITAILAVVSIAYRMIKKKQLDPFVSIVIGAILGITVNMFK